MAHGIVEPVHLRVRANVKKVPGMLVHSGTTMLLTHKQSTIFTDKTLKLLNI